MSGIPADVAVLPSKINIGCGFDIREGYLNVDSGSWHKPDLIADVTDLSMLPGGHFQEALAQDVLEHIGRVKQVATLQGWSRLLRDGGVLHVRVPSIIDMVKLLHEPPFRNSLEQQSYWIQMLYGTQAYPGDFHLCGYTYLTLADLGRQAGLLLSRLAIKDQWLFDVSFKKAAGLGELNDEEFLSYLYATVLQRAPDPSGLQYWLKQLQANVFSRADVEAEFTRAAAR